MKRIPLFLLLLIGLLCLTAVPALAAEEPAPYDVSDALHSAEQALAEHIAGLADKYSYYYTPEEYRLMFDDYQGEFGGVGVSMVDNDDGEVAIYNVLKDTPAYRDGSIQPGDIIKAVDGESIEGLESSLAALRIRGEAGQPVTLTMQREQDQTLYDVTLLRELIHSESVTGERVEEIADTAYICVYDFNAHTAEDFVALYNELRAAGPIENLVIDLRSNGGGNFYAAINIANYFIRPGLNIVSEKTNEGIKEYNSVSGQLAGLRLFVLMNQWSASASEVLAGALRDSAGALLVGSQSYGKGVTQSLGQLDSGAGMRYTRSRYYTPSGYDLHGVGLIPDIPAEDPEGISSEDYFSYQIELNPHLRAVDEYIKAGR